MSLRVTWGDVEGLRRFDNMLKSLGDKKMRMVANRAINRTGDMARTQVRKALAKQTGLPLRKVIYRAVRVTRSKSATLVYRMEASGGDVALKYFGAKETRKGVSAAPFGKRRVFAGTFIKGGRFPGRVPLNMGGQVFKRTGAGREIEKQKSGVIIPAEMVKGATAEAFTSTVARVLPERIEHELKRATGGVLS